MTKKKNENDDLIGFRDFLDHEHEKTSQKMSKKRDTDFELITFLEQDSKRITKHIETFEEKIYVLKNYPQDIKLLSDQEFEVTKSKVKVIANLSRNDSPLLINLAELFRTYFNS
jgi:hypothetical protein